MALSNAQRQARYRQRHYRDGDKTRLEAGIGSHAHAAMLRLARHWSLPDRAGGSPLRSIAGAPRARQSITAVVERVLVDAELAATDGMDRKQIQAYFADL